MVWRIEVSAAAGKDLAALDRAVAGRILRFLDRRIACLDDPRRVGEALRGPVLGRFWEYRVGDHRVIVDIQDQVLLILMVRIGNRRTCIGADPRRLTFSLPRCPHPPAARA